MGIAAEDVGRGLLALVSSRAHHRSMDAEPKPSRWTQADLTRAIKGVLAAGLTVHSVTIEKSGKFFIDIAGEAGRKR